MAGQTVQAARAKLARTDAKARRRSRQRSATPGADAAKAARAAIEVPSIRRATRC